MYSFIILGPLLSFFSLIGFGRFIGRKGAIVLSIFCLSMSWIFNLSAFLYILKTGDICYINLYDWIDTGLLEISFFFVFDALTVIMLLLVLTISLVVHIYSVDYMKYDPHLQRFLSYLSLFTFFMILLVTSSNLVQLFFGWEGVGICSYLLISFWFMRLDACKSAIKAVVFNKFGDCSLLIAISIIFFFAKSLNFPLIFNFFNPFYFSSDFLISSFTLIDIVSLFLLIAAVGKSVQFLLHPWLADAMEGPTPVSALIHAATMVTAGIFLIIRCSFLIIFSEKVSIIMALIGCLTILFSSTTGFFQNDLKKIIAYSTCSQLGYMLVACSFLSYKVALFHLFNHGFFKALLFLSAGFVIHNFMEEQDMRKMGGLVQVLPLTYIYFFVGSISLMGFPFLTGFYSKDLLIEYVYLAHFLKSYGFFCYHLCCFCAFLTGAYSFRLLYFVFWSKPNGYKRSYNNISGFESDYFSVICLSILSFLSVFVGYMFYDLFLGLGSNFFEGSICLFNDSIQEFAILKKYNEFLIVYPIKILPLFYTLFSVFFIFQIFYYNAYMAYICLFNNLFYSIYVFFNQAWFLNYLNKYIMSTLFNLSVYFYYFDKSVLEWYGPVGIQRIINFFTKKINFFQINDLYNYFYAFFSVIILLLILMFSSNVLI